MGKEYPREHNMAMHRESGKLYQDPLYGPKVLTPLAVTGLG